VADLDDKLERDVEEVNELEVFSSPLEKSKEQSADARRDKKPLPPLPKWVNFCKEATSFNIKLVLQRH